MVCSLAQETVTDYEGREYPVVRIGGQAWMGENLETETGPDGTMITSYCFYHDTSFCARYGRLYSWDVAMAGSKEEQARGICPKGWHIPSDDDWEQLTNALGGHNDAGKAMSVNGGAGFDVIYAGNYNPITDVFSYINLNAYYWSSTSYSEKTAWMRQKGHNMSNINRSTVRKHYCFSIRCVKDAEPSNLENGSDEH